MRLPTAIACALALAPPPAGALPLLALARAREDAAEPVAAGSGAGSVEALRKEARTQLRARRFAEAIRDYQQILEAAPGDIDALSHVAQLQAWTGNYDQAIVVYRDAIARRPSDLGLKSDLADVLSWSRRLEEAERLYEEVLAEKADHLEALKGLAHVRLLRGDAAGADQTLQHGLALYPQDVDLWRERARMLSQRGDLGAAVEALRKAVALAPSDADAQRHLADVLLRRRDYQEAVNVWLKVAQLEPDSAAPHVALARAYQGLGRASLAREHLALALRMSPTDAAANQLLAEMDREARFAPIRSASDAFEFVAYVALLPLAFLVARKSKRALRRRPAAWTFAFYVVPGFLLLNIGIHLARGVLWHWMDLRPLEAATEVVLFLGLGVAFQAMLRADSGVREFAGQVVLVIGAHPDDIELGCGGFLLKLKDSGAKVYGLTMTCGEKGTNLEGKREEEALKAARFMELDGHWVLAFPDTGLQESVPHMRKVIEKKIQELAATMVLTHTDVDVHGDHRAVHAATREAARAVPTVLCYEDVSTTNQFTPNFYVDIGSYIDDHLKACAFHRSQAHRSYMDPEVIRGRAAHRGMQIGVSFAQAFRTLNLVR